MQHKMTHKPKQKEVVVIKITIEGLPDDLVKKCIELRIPKGISLKDAKILDEAWGSLIIWTQMSTAAFKSKDVFFTAIEKILKEIFSKSPVDINRAADVTLDIAIEDDDYENDEDDIFRCGVCSKEFCVLEAFQRHKLRICRQRTTVSGKKNTA
ncbi:uncharacterized protein LOC127732083 [Mytilus californianus]|uniref:uncharacterized protein LOC127732083 n=1 Tax=Mytilus californianus TaxID=6549 RepID=UPI0022475B06|nr:uncharacterized protein LOC127732083 [Mytilus californianus]